MSQAEITAVNFNEQLSLEAERVLADVIFVRAPIQSQLLRFLVQRTIAGNGPITQFEIAVDGLGKDDDYLIESDSYPRVQISRLRRNLENYYGRNLPSNGFQIAIERGSYCLTLVHASRVAPNEAAESPIALATNQNEPKPWRTPARVGLSLLALTALASIPFSLGSEPPPVPKIAHHKPSTAVVFDTKKAIQSDQTNAGLIETARWIAKVQLSNSFVSKPLAVGRSVEQADYTLGFNFGSGLGGRTTLFLSMADRDGDILYSNTIPFNPDRPSAFSNEIEASLVSMTSPAGLIAEAELPDLSMAGSTDYTCFLAVEGHRAKGDETAQLVDRCLDLYPDSEYRAFWFARRSFSAYQRDVVSGLPVQKSGRAWRDLQAALNADRYNAFANFVAAKVELALGNCEQALSFVNRALERGGSYPTLIAAVEANAASCSFGGAKTAEMTERVRALIEFNPNPDPMLQLYMIIGAMAAGDRALAEQVTRRTVIANPTGRVEEAVDLLKRSLANPETAQNDRKRLASVIYTFVWNEPAVEAILDGLTAA